MAETSERRHGGLVLVREVLIKDGARNSFLT